MAQIYSYLLDKKRVTRMDYNPIKPNRVRLRMSTKELAEILNVKVSKIYEWESGRSFPSSITYVRKMVELFAVNEDEFLKDLMFSHGRRRLKPEFWIEIEPAENNIIYNFNNSH